MKKMTLVAIIMMAAMNVMNAQSTLDIVPVFTWGPNSHLTPEDTIPIGDSVDGKYNGYLPVVIECPDVAEIVDIAKVCFPDLG